MGKYYKDADDLYRIYGYFMDRILTDEKIGQKMAKAGAADKEAKAAGVKADNQVKTSIEIEVAKAKAELDSYCTSFLN